MSFQVNHVNKFFYRYESFHAFSNHMTAQNISHKIHIEIKHEYLRSRASIRLSLSSSPSSSSPHLFLFSFNFTAYYCLFMLTNAYITAIIHFYIITNANMTEDFSLKALDLGTMRLSASAEDQ